MQDSTTVEHKNKNYSSGDKFTRTKEESRPSEQTMGSMYAAQPDSSSYLPDHKGKIGEYHLVREVGDGGFGVAWQAFTFHDNKVETVCCKVFKSLEKDVKESYVDELKVFPLKLEHVNIVNYRDAGMDNLVMCKYPQGKKLYIASDFAANGDLFDYIQNTDGLSEPVCRRVLFQILTGLKYLHDNGIVHRDMKLENILVDGDVNMKICDFGMMKVFEGEGASVLKTYCGTPQYKAPELRQAVHCEYEGPPVDVFALGVVLFMMLTAKPPFNNSDDKYYKKLKADPVRAC